MKSDPAERLVALLRQADDEFAAIQRRHESQMQCRAGCSACCRARLSVTRVEETFLHRGLATFADERRDAIRARTREIGREMCPALDDDGSCGIYAYRPVICRTFGAPLLRRRAVPMVNPPTVDVCDINFTQTSLRVLPRSDVIDQTATELELRSIDREHCARLGLPRDERIPLATILA